MSISGSTMDPSRELGEYESKAIELLGEPLVHEWLNDEQRQQRDAQMRVLYEQHGWSLSDVGRAWDITKEWARTCIRRAGGTMRTGLNNNQIKRYPG